MKMHEPTSQQTADFYLAMLRHFSAFVRDKSDSGRMRAAAWFLDALQIMDASQIQSSRQW